MTHLSKTMLIFAAFIGIFFVASAEMSLAVSLNDQITGQINAGVQTGGLGVAKSPQETLASLVQIFLGFLATIFLILVVMSGYWLVTARGNDQKHEKAMDTLRRATIGFIVIIMAYGISLFVGSIIKDAVNVGDGKRDCGFIQRLIQVGDNSPCKGQ